MNTRKYHVTSYQHKQYRDQSRNFLATNQTNLQRSLGRLASGSRIVRPSDDAGGLAVGSKLTATVNRNVRSQQNVSNAISFLQVQDGALSSVGKILDHMSELKTMSLDVTKNSLDIANYDAEFNQLQDQLANIRQEKFNGINLFSTGASGPSGLSAYTTESGDGVINTSTKQVDTISVLSGDATTAGETYNITIDGVALGAVTFTTDAATTAGLIQAAIDTQNSTNAGALVATVVNGTQIEVEAGTAGEVFDLSITVTDGWNGTDPGNVVPAIDIETTTHVQTKVNLSTLNIYEVGTASKGLISSNSFDLTDSSQAAGSGGDLASYSIDDFTQFIQNGATSRANNGAEMSRLEASLGLLVTNQANLEAARSRLMDVDIATESTHFAKHNILVQSSAAMLAQANGVPNVACNYSANGSYADLPTLHTSSVYDGVSCSHPVGA